MTTVRSQDEILARLQEAQDRGEDFLGFAQEVLLDALDWEHIQPRLEPDSKMTAEEWNTRSSHDSDSYLRFAITKILDHRGISASRSVSKLREYAWLAGREDVVQAMDDAEYENYGAPKVKAFAEGMGFGWVGYHGAKLTGYNDAEIASLNRMADGRPCVEDCQEGCGQD